MAQLGQYPNPQHVIAHISDTHFLADGALLYGSVHTERNLVRALEQLELSGIRPEALIFTGDLADLGEPNAYARLRELVEPVAERLGATVVWVMGNHDERLQYSQLLFDVEGSEAPQDRVYDLGGLRVISLDTTVTGYHHGNLTDAQLDWLADILATPAPHGTLIAMHHPPIPTPLVRAMQILELQGQDRLAAVVRGTDVRGILGGHLHYATHSTFAGIPVAVAAATCYTMNLTQPRRLFSGADSGQSMTIVSVYDDQIVHSIVPIGETIEITGFPDERLADIERMTLDEQIEMFSKKASPFNAGAEADVPGANDAPDEDA